MILREGGLFPFFQGAGMESAIRGRTIRAAGGLFPFFQGVDMGSVTSRGAHDIRARAPQGRSGVGGANARMDHCDGQAVLYYPTEERELNQRRGMGRIR